MPIYEYACEHCGVFEEMQRINDAPLAKCPKCKRKVRRLISQTSFQLKGSGWYVTDYARKGNGGSKKDDAGAATGSSDSKSEGGKSDSAKSEGDKGAAKAKAETKSSSGSSGAKSES